MRLLIAEDEKQLNEVLVERLKQENYAVDSCFNGLEAWEYIESVDYDAIILDIMMPGLDGLSLIKKLRDKGIKTPVIFLTAKDSISDRVAGLQAGANDYLIKPFAFEELLARVGVMTREVSYNTTGVFVLADLEVDCNQRRVFRGGKEISLSGKEFAVLELLIRNKGIVLSKEKIEQHIWDYSFEGDDSIIKVYIRYLRKKIDDPYDQKLIHTVRNFGYVLREES